MPKILQHTHIKYAQGGKTRFSSSFSTSSLSHRSNFCSCRHAHMLSECELWVNWIPYRTLSGRYTRSQQQHQQAEQRRWRRRRRQRLILWCNAIFSEWEINRCQCSFNKERKKTERRDERFGKKNGQTWRTFEQNVLFSSFQFGASQASENRTDSSNLTIFYF